VDGRTHFYGDGCEPMHVAMDHPEAFRAICAALHVDADKLIRDIFDDADQVTRLPTMSDAMEHPRRGQLAYDLYRLRVENAALKARLRKLEHRLHKGRLRVRRLMNREAIDARVSAGDRSSVAPHGR